MPCKKIHYRVAIIGSGPAGWTAALYASRAELEPVVFEGPQPGGQLTITTEVENYPGFVDGIQGPELMNVFRLQAERFGTKFEVGEVKAVDLRKRPFELEMSVDTRMIGAEALIVSTGATAELLGIESETQLMGEGVRACATCDGAFFRNKEAVVVGGGDTAMEEATFLTRFCTKVTIVHRRSSLRASKIMQDRAAGNPNTAFIWDSVIEEIYGEPKTGVSGVRLKNVETGKVSDFRPEAG